MCVCVSVCVCVQCNITDSTSTQLEYYLSLSKDVTSRDYGILNYIYSSIVNWYSHTLR